MICDIHTHSVSAQDALICTEPQCFAPTAGKIYSVGIHPWHTDVCTSEALELLEQVAAHPQVAAIGETGLDSLRGAPINAQIEIFKRHIELAEKLGKPLMVHMVRTSQEVAKQWRLSRQAVPWAIHGMRGNPNVARELIAAGFYLSFGARFNAATLQATPLNRILAETDDDSTVSIDDVVARIADAISMPQADVKRLVSRNAATFLGL